MKKAKKINNSEETLKKLKAFYVEYLQNVGADTEITVSNRNSKMGEIPSVSLAPVITCANCAKCAKNCYALHGRFCFSSAQKSLAKNTAMAKCYPQSYWNQVNKAVSLSRFFRFHVAGDFISYDYFRHVVDIATLNPHCKILAFTKQYQMVNDWIDSYGCLPENLQIIFSRWEGMPCQNRHNLPESHVITPNMDSLPKEWKICGGDCSACASNNCGCWTLDNGEHIAFYQH